MDIVKRATWGARAPGSTVALRTSANWFAHWEGTDYSKSMTHVQVMRAIQNFHMDSRGWEDIAYHFVIFPDGTVYEGRGFGVKGAATQGRNEDSMAFCFAWGPSGKATPAALQAAHDLIEYGRAEHSLPTLLHPHSDARPTQCPGDELRAWAHAYTHTVGEPNMLDSPTMTNAAFVDDSYVRILKTSPDAAGYAFWNGKLDRNEMTRGDLRHEFYLVRFASEDAATAAVAAAVAQISTGQVDVVAVATKAKELFYKELAAFAAAHVSG